MESTLFQITEHAYCRMKQRNGWNKKTANRMVKRVYDCGQRPNQIKGYLKTWIKSKVVEDSKGNDFILYGQTIYVFREKVLITVLHTPSRKYVEEYLY